MKRSELIAALWRASGGSHGDASGMAPPPSQCPKCLMHNIDIYGPEHRPFCPACLDPIQCAEQQGCVWPPFTIATGRKAP